MSAWLAAIGAGLAAIVVAWFGGSARGRQQAKRQAAESVVKDVRKAKDVESKVKRDSPLARRRKLRQWTRK